MCRSLQVQRDSFVWISTIFSKPYFLLGGWWDGGGIKSFFLPQRKILTSIFQYAHNGPGLLHSLRPREEPMWVNFQNWRFILKLLPPLKQFLVSSSITEEFIMRRKTYVSERSWPFCFPVYGHYLCSCGFHSSKSVLGLEICSVHSSLTNYCLSVNTSHPILSTFLCLNFFSTPPQKRAPIFLTKAL